MLGAVRYRFLSWWVGSSGEGKRQGTGGTVRGRRGNVTALRLECRGLGLRRKGGGMIMQGLHVFVDQPASLLATREGFLWGRSWGVGMWSPVISVFSGAAVGNCLFFIFALAML